MDRRKGEPNSNYMTHQQEMVAKILYFVNNNITPYIENFLTDNMDGWELYPRYTRTTIRPHQCAEYTRSVFNALGCHHLGKSLVDNMATSAERNLELARYSGETRKWIFNKYVKVHMDQHQILTDLKDHGYIGIDERSKVRHLMAGIKTDHLDAVKTQIISSITLRSDFAACVTLYKDFIS